MKKRPRLAHLKKRFIKLIFKWANLCLFKYHHNITTNGCEKITTFCHSSVDSSAPMSWSPGFKFQAHHQCFYIVSFFLYLTLHWERDENEQKEAGFGQYLKSNQLLSGGGGVKPMISWIRGSCHYHLTRGPDELLLSTWSLLLLYLVIVRISPKWGSRLSN